MDVDLGNAVGGLGDAAGKLARGDLALLAQDQDRLAQPRDDHHLHRQQRDHHQTQHPVLHHDEDDRRQRLAAQEHRLHEGVADEAAERLDLVLDHGGELGLLDLAEMGRRKAQDAVVEFVAQAAQHAFAHPAFLRVDGAPELRIHDHGGQEHEAHDEEVVGLVYGQAVEQPDRIAETQEGRQRDIDAEDRLGRFALESRALDSVIDDRLGYAQRQKVEDLRQHHI